MRAEIEKAIAQATWKSAPPPPATDPHKARFWSGCAGDIHFFVCSFEVDGQIGYDGTMTATNLLMRLTRELAELAVKTAEKKT